MEKYQESNKISKKKYNSDKTFVQISKELHKKIKDHCNTNGLSVKDFLEEIILKNL
jgi:predicted HicB family RNase H-like nuclease